MGSRKLTQDIVRILLPHDYSPRDEVWDKVEKMLDQHAAEARADQAEICADAVGNVPTHMVATIANGNAIRGLIREDLAMKACLNAVEKEDEGR